MNLTEEKETEDAVDWLAELQFYEQHAKRLTEAIERKNKEYAKAEVTLVKMVNENLTGPSQPVKFIGCTTGTDDGDRVYDVTGLQYELESARQTLETSQRNEGLAATALSRIKAFISLHDENRKLYLDELGKAAQYFQNARSECEHQKKELKQKLGFSSEKDSLNEGRFVSGEEQLQFSPGDEKLAPHYVKVMRRASFLLESILATYVLLKKMGDLCLIRRTQLRDAHDTTRSQLLRHQGVIRDISSAIDANKEVISALRVANSKKTEVKAELQSNLQELDVSKHIESLTTVNDVAKKTSTELSIIEQVLLDAVRSSQCAQDAEREASELVQLESLEFERANEAVNHARQGVMGLEKEKNDILDNIESFRLLKQRHVLEADKYEQKIKKVQDKNDYNEHDKNSFEKEAEQTHTTLTEAKKRVEMLVVQLESKETRKAMLYNEKEVVDGSIEALKAECVHSRNQLTEVRKTALMLRQQVAKSTDRVRYILSLAPEKGVSISVASLSLEQGGCNGFANECLREVLALKDRSLVGKARKEHRLGTLPDKNICRGEKEHDLVYSVLGGSKGVLQEPLSSTVVRKLPQTETTMFSLVASPSPEHHPSNNAAVDFQMSSAFVPMKEQSTEATNRILETTPCKDLLSPPNTTAIYVTKRIMAGNYSGRQEAMSPSLQKDPGARAKKHPSYQDRDGGVETTPTITRINHRLQEILSRNY